MYYLDRVDSIWEVTVHDQKTYSARQKRPKTWWQRSTSLLLPVCLSTVIEAVYWFVAVDTSLLFLCLGSSQASTVDPSQIESISQPGQQPWPGLYSVSSQIICYYFEMSLFMDGEGSSEIKGPVGEHVFDVHIADSNGEELPEVLRTCALANLYRLQWSECMCNHSVHSVLLILFLQTQMQIEHHLKLRSQVTPIQFHCDRFFWFWRMVAGLTVHLIFPFPISSGCWRCSGEAPVDMPSSWAT